MALADNLISYWKLDESGTATATSSVGSYDLTAGGNATHAAGKINNGLEFDGTDDYYTGGDVLDFEKTNPFSLSAWVYIHDRSVTRSVVGKFDGNNGYGMVVRDTGHPVFYLGQAANGLISKRIAETIPVNEWHHIVTTYDGSNQAAGAGVNVYLDGALGTPDQTGGPVTGSTITALPFNIGSSNNGAYADMDGVVDEVGVWSRALSSAEVTSLYNGGAGIQYPFTGSVFPFSPFPSHYNT